MNLRSMKNINLMEDYICQQLKESGISRQNGTNKEMDLEDFIKSRNNRLKELFPNVCNTKKLKGEIRTSIRG